ncbi:MAG: hypothetical protein CSA65_07825 [Proteobacteria bacterium]|nr:MAG: hypothetical protein CSA65_07825 [Pseudomonadota bacterium]
MIRRSTGSVLALATTLALVGSPSALANEAPCPRGCADHDLRCLRRRARCLQARGRGKEALGELKALRRKKTGSARDPALTRLTAQAYLAVRNTFWAQRLLIDALRLRPADCQSRALLAWIQLGQGDVDLTREAIQNAERVGCVARAEDRARWALLRARLASVAGTPVALRAALDRATDAGRVYPEDRALWRSLRRQSLPRYQPPFSLRAELAAGYTSNLNANLPLTSSLASSAAGFGSWDLVAAFVYPSQRLRPAIEVGFKGQYTDNVNEALSRDASHLSLNARPGVYLATGHGRYFFGYRGELYWIAAGDRYDDHGLWFFESHRGEVELELSGGTTFFAGFGRRLFRRRGRDRWEVDGGLGHGFRFAAGRLLLLAALSLRHLQSEAAIFDANGGSLLTALTVALPWELSARVGVSASLDYYGDAPRVEGGQEVGRGGVDLAIKVNTTLWSPPLVAGIQLGVGYQYSWRRTKLLVSFPYEDHRLALRLRWSLRADPWTPAVAPQPPRRHVPIDYGLGARGRGRLDDERVQDLLRQDEAARRGSSCVN